MIKALSYIKKNLLGIFVAFGVTSFLYEGLFTASLSFTLTKTAFVLTFLTVSYERYNDRIKLRSKLKKRGLEETDLVNIKFVNNWEQIRKRGIWRYCLYNGGVITGMILIFPVSFIMFQISPDPATLFSDLSNMMLFILKSVIIGHLTGAIYYRINWNLNQRMYTQLTNPIQ